MESVLAVDILRAMGEEMRLQREDLMDAVTAISGSGPAYFFYLCEIIGGQGNRLWLYSG